MNFFSPLEINILKKLIYNSIYMFSNMRLLLVIYFLKLSPPEKYFARYEMGPLM